MPMLFSPTIGAAARSRIEAGRDGVPIELCRLLPPALPWSDFTLVGGFAVLP